MTNKNGSVRITLFLAAYAPSIVLSAYNLLIYPSIFLPDQPRPEGVIYQHAIQTGHFIIPSNGFWPGAWFFWSFFSSLTGLNIEFSAVFLMSVVILLAPTLVYVIVNRLFGRFYAVISLLLYSMLPSTYYILNYDDFRYAQLIFLMLIASIVMLQEKRHLATIPFIILTAAMTLSHPLISIIALGAIFAYSLRIRSYFLASISALMFATWSIFAQSVLILKQATSFSSFSEIFSLMFQTYFHPPSSAVSAMIPRYVATILNYYHYALYGSIGVISIYALFIARSTSQWKIATVLPLGTLIGGLALGLLSSPSLNASWQDRTIFFVSEMLILPFLLVFYCRKSSLLRFLLLAGVVLTLITMGSTLAIINSTNQFTTPSDNFGNSFLAKHYSGSGTIASALAGDLEYNLALEGKSTSSVTGIVHPLNEFQIGSLNILVLYSDHQYQSQLGTPVSIVNETEVYDSEIVTVYLP